MSHFDYEGGLAPEALGVSCVNNLSLYAGSFWDYDSVADHKGGCKACEKSIARLVKIRTQCFRQTHCQHCAVGQSDLLRLTEGSCRSRDRRRVGAHAKDLRVRRMSHGAARRATTNPDNSRI